MAATFTTGGLTYTAGSGSPSGTGDHTAMCWVNVSSLSASSRIFVQSYTTGSNPFTNLFVLNTGVLRYRERDNGVEVTCTGGSTLSTGTWYHLAVTLAGTAMTAWLNGVSDGTATKSANTRTTGTSMVVGTSAANGSYHLCQFRWFEGIAMSQAQIVQEMRSARPRNGNLYYHLPFHYGISAGERVKDRFTGRSDWTESAAPAEVVFGGAQGGSVAPSSWFFTSAAATQTITVPAIASGTTVRTPSQLKMNVTVPAIASGTTVRTPALTIGIAVPAIASGTTVRTPTVQSLIKPGAIASTTTIYAPAKLNQTLTTPAIASTITVHTPAMKLALTVPAIASGTTVHAPSGVTRLGEIQVPAIASTTTLHSPALQRQTTGLLGVRLGSRLGSHIV